MSDPLTTDDDLRAPFNCDATHPDYPEVPVRYIQDRNGHELATLYQTLSYNSQGEKAARLFAAAPELYAALNEVLGTFDLQTMEEILRKDCDPHDEDEFCVNITAKQLRAINDAILKAEGKL